MRTGRSPGARSGLKLSGWYVDAVNGLAGAGFCESSPRASAQGERAIRDRLGFFTYAPASPFRKEEGGKAPCCPRRAPNMVSPVSCKRVIRVDVRAPFVGGRLWGPETRPKVPAGDLPDPVPWRRGPRARCLPPMGFRYKIVPAGLGNVLGYLGSAARALVMYRTYPWSSLARCLRRL